MEEIHIFTILQENWAILVSFVGLIWSYANLKGHVGQLHIKVTDKCTEDEKLWHKNEVEHSVMNKRIEDMQPVWMEIRERLVKIETMLTQYKPKR